MIKRPFQFSFDRAWSALHRRIRAGSIEAYAFAALLTAIAALVRLGLGFLGDDIPPLSTFYPAILFAGLLGGMSAGIFAAILGGIIGWWAFVPPAYEFLPLNEGQHVSMWVYAIASLVMIWGADHHRRLSKQLEQEETLRKLAVAELSHRLKNKVATIQSIVSYQLRDYPEIRNDIAGRLGALSSTDDLIMATQGQGASLRDIVSTELGPYEASRATVQGPDVILAPRLAMTIALVLHELATNAAKYGAFTSPAGRLSVLWSLADSQLKLDWCESGGPPVGPPTQRGFGMRLLSMALNQFDGKVDCSFEPAGFACAMSMRLSQDKTNEIPFERISSKNSAAA